MSQSDLRVHVGLGQAPTIAQLEVRWANGPTVAYTITRVDAVVTIDQQRGVSYGGPSAAGK